MTYQTIDIPNIDAKSSYTNDTYTDRTGKSHSGSVCIINKLIDYSYSIQSSSLNEFNRVEQNIQSIDGLIESINNSITSINAMLTQQSGAIDTNSQLISALTQHVSDESSRVNGLIAGINVNISNAQGDILSIKSQLQTLSDSVNTLSSMFYSTTQSKILRIIGSYNYFSDLPSLTGAGTEGSFSTVGHDTDPVRGDFVYQAASGSWKKVPNWNIVGVFTSLQQAPSPTGIGDIVAIGANGVYTLYQPMSTTNAENGDVSYEYDPTRQLASLSFASATVNSLPAVVSPNGSVATFKYRYNVLDTTAFDGESAYYLSNEYMYRNGDWVQRSPNKVYFAIAVNGTWNTL